MAGKVFFSVSMSLDGFIAPPAGKDAGLRGADVSHDPEQQLFEYACHEGNYGLRNILENARDEERKAAEARR